MHNMKTRRFAALLAAAVVVAGCTPGGGSPEPEASGDGAQAGTKVQDLTKEDLEGKTINYLYFTDGPDQAATESLIKQFEEEYGVTVKLEIVPFSDLETTLQARLSGGQAPDVARLTNTSAFDGDLLDLAPYLGEDYPEEYVEGVRVGMEDGDGKMIAVPSDLTMNGIFVNTAMFEEAGVDLPSVDEPWTWEEMVTDAQKVQDAAGTEFAFALDKSGHRLSTVLSQNGTFLVDGEGGVLDAAKATEALTPLAEMIADGTSPKDFWLDSGTKYKGANEVFLAEQVPVYLSGNWQVAQFDTNATFDWKAVPNPCLAECGGFPGGKFMAAFSSSKEKEAAAAFLHFMNTAESQAQFVDASNFLPTRADLVEKGVDYSKRSEDMDVFLADLKRTPADSYAAVYSPEFGAAATELVDAFATVVGGQEDLGAAMDALADSLNG